MTADGWVATNRFEAERAQHSLGPHPPPPARDLAAEPVDRGDGWHVSPELLPEGHPATADRERSTPHRRGSPRLVLPTEFADILRRLYPPERRDPLELGAVIAAGMRQGWTYRAFAEALGLSPQWAGVLARRAPESMQSPVQIPDPPTKPARTKPSWPVLTAEQAEHLRDLNRRAQVRGSMPSDHPAVEAGRELAHLLYKYHHQDGHRLADLARTLGLTKPAIRQRLGRYGYQKQAPSLRRDRGPVSGPPVDWNGDCYTEPGHPGQEDTAGDSARTKPSWPVLTAEQAEHLRKAMTKR